MSFPSENLMDFPVTDIYGDALINEPHGKNFKMFYFKKKFAKLEWQVDFLHSYG